MNACPPAGWGDSRIIMGWPFTRHLRNDSAVPHLPACTNISITPLPHKGVPIARASRVEGRSPMTRMRRRRLRSILLCLVLFTVPFTVPLHAQTYLASTTAAATAVTVVLPTFATNQTISVNVFYFVGPAF
jgi:hypothetical protein